MSTSNITRLAIQAGSLLLGRELVIKTDSDFTPTGKRTARVVRHAKNGFRAAPHIRWYVGGKTYRSLLLTNENVDLTAKWSISDRGFASSASQLALL
jgi:hypothetical protein